MQIMVTADDLHTVAEHGMVVSVTGTLSGSRGVRRVTFNGERDRMSEFLIRVAATGQAIATVEPWQVLGDG